ncbi:MAG TPA: hypothetical protein VFN82_01790 [Solirubrobacterales bacterium]|jgi:hypothetical protein|nr:hypothetical protein [Solirubrobacterales bacterium]
MPPTAWRTAPAPELLPAEPLELALAAGFAALDLAAFGFARLRFEVDFDEAELFAAGGLFDCVLV